MLRREFMMGAAAAAAMPPEEAFELVSAGFAIPCKIARPAGTAKGAVLLLPGSLFSDADGNYPQMQIFPHVYADLAGQLAALGYASLRMAKIGPGTGSRVVSAEAAKEHTAFAVRVTHAAEALRRLKEAVPEGRLILAGHSEGALVASLLAAIPLGEAAEGVVSLAGPSKRLLDILRAQVAPMGDLAVFDQAVAAIRAGQPLPEAAKGNALTAGLAGMPPASLTYLQDVDRIDPTAAAARVRKPMLLVQGGRDASVAKEQVIDLAKAREGLPTEVRVFPTLSHFFKDVPDGMAAQASMAINYDSDPAVAQAVADWAEALPPP